MRLLSLALLSSVGLAAVLEGIELPDTIESGGHQLLLNGLGLREFLFIDIYVGGLYLPARTTDERVAIEPDVPKRLELHFVHRVGVEDMRRSIDDAIEKNPAAGAAIAGHLGRLSGALEAMAPGDVVVFDYLPDRGTRILVKGELKDTVEGVPFMQGLWALYVGPAPPTRNLKRGLLGG